MPDFVHLHVHTDYSMLDGACRVTDLVQQAKAFGMPAVACTDHGNMCAAVDLYQACAAQKIKPILGCEVYVAPGHMTDKNSHDAHAQGYHLILLAETDEGYRNLCLLNSAANLEGYYYKPRVDKALLAKHHQGLIALTACIAGEVPVRLLEGAERQAEQTLQSYLEIFGRDHLFIELQDHGMAEEKKVNPRLVALARKFNLGLVATNDSHYLKKEDAVAHDVLLCIGTQTTVADPKRMRFSGPEFYFKPAEEMATLFAEYPEALSNTVAIAERCQVSLKIGSHSQNHYPVYHPPEGFTREEYLRHLCLQGMNMRYGFDATGANLSPEEHEKLNRMNLELAIIAKTGFVSYFLVVWDFLHYARAQGIPVGPGRGSGAGSIVAYLTQITDIDPLRYGLLFERFLNPERVSPPDFDIDLCERRRQEVIAYVRQKYGEANVAQIGTFGTLKARQVIKDVVRATGRPFQDGNLLTKLIPADPKMTLEKALEDTRELRDLVERESWVQEVFRYSKVLEGLNRNFSIHAAGVIIGDQPLAGLVPLARGAADEVITQYSAANCESLGLLKMDFLGLRTLTILDDTLDLVEKNRGTRPDLSTLPLDDPPTYELLNRGDTVAVFQLESGGMQNLCRNFGVNRIEDIIAMIALYRPGPMQFLDDFTKRKHGKATFDYDVPVMEQLLAETYGIMLYQEQVMQVVQKVAGFTLGQADILRRAMGKKKLKEMEQQHSRFMEGCKANGIREETAENIWAKITMFAGYGFNKSHSAAYAMLSFQTAYFKANYPVEFMAAVLTSELGNAEKLSYFLAECRAMGIAVKPPDVNISGRQFTVDGRIIRFGLAAIKGVGEAAADAITGARGEKPYKSLADFCERVGPKLSRRVLECLCKTGAFDSFGLRRSQLLEMLDPVLSRSLATAQDRARGQGSLFDFVETETDHPAELAPPDLPEWKTRDLLAFEKELLGVYVSGHPLTEHEPMLKTFATSSISRLQEVPADTGVRIGGLITSLDLKLTKKDSRAWAVIGLEGLDGTIECLAFPEAYEKAKADLILEAPVLIEGLVNVRESDTPKIMVERVIPLDRAPEELTAEIHLRINQKKILEPQIQRLMELCQANPGTAGVTLCVICDSGDIAFLKPGNCSIRNSLAFRLAVLDLLGPEGLVEKPLKPAVTPRPRFGDRGNGRDRTAARGNGQGA